jgi:peroxiredoxin
MKKLIYSLAFVAIVAITVAFTNAPEGPEIKTLEIGKTAPEIGTMLKQTNGEELMLRTLVSKKGLLVVFSCNTCPFVVAWEDRYNDIYDLCKANGIEMILVNSNEARRDGDDAPKAMDKHAEKLGYKANYLIDEKSSLANAWGARTTPHVFLFDPQFILRYEGAIDDNHKNKEEVTQQYLMNAIKNLGEGKTIDPANTKALGCSIKRV